MTKTKRKKELLLLAGEFAVLGMQAYLIYGGDIDEEANRSEEIRFQCVDAIEEITGWIEAMEE